MRTFVLKSVRRERVWTIDPHGRVVLTTAGAAGAFPDVQTKLFDSADEASAAAAEMIAAQTAKGFVETTPIDTSDAAAFERAIRDNPNDPTPWAAYADYLTERGDPRGEFMQVQLALEDESKPAAERKRLQAREAELLKEHEREWLGPLADHVLPDERGWRHGECVWRRGFPATIKPSPMTVAFTQAVTDAPIARLLLELRLGDMGNLEGDHTPVRGPVPPDVDPAPMHELIEAPALRNVRVFQIGLEEPPEDGWTDCYSYGTGVHHLVARMPRIEEVHLLCKGYDSGPLFALRNLTNLRVLRMYHLGGYGRAGSSAYALNVLAKNPALGNLTHLLFHPHCEEDGESYLPLDQVRHLLRSKHLPSLTHLQLRLSDMGDDGAREIVRSGMLKRLKSLDLRHGCITDEGARTFAACPDAAKLERLDLTRNAVTPAGLELLRRAGVNAVADNPLTAAELDDRVFLREGDFE